MRGGKKGEVSQELPVRKGNLNYSRITFGFLSSGLTGNPGLVHQQGQENHLFIFGRDSRSKVILWRILGHILKGLTKFDLKTIITVYVTFFVFKNTQGK